MIEPHSPQPRICSECADALLNAVENGQTVDWSYCRHHNVLAMITTQNRRIVAWNNSGPIDGKGAQEIVKNAAENLLGDEAH